MAENDRRVYPRYDFPVPIKFVLNTDKTEQLLEAVTIDISKSGISFYTDQLLSVGQEITIKTILPTPSQMAVVRWVSKFDDIYYKIGLSFIS
jgi:c-di-GMP-binding flagellar brake protein YcgR